MKKEEVQTEMFTYAEAAKILGIGLNTLRRMVAKGQVRPERMGSRRLGFPKEKFRAQFGL